MPILKRKLRKKIAKHSEVIRTQEVGIISVSKRGANLRSGQSDGDKGRKLAHEKREK